MELSKLINSLSFTHRMYDNESTDSKYQSMSTRFLKALRNGASG